MGLAIGPSACSSSEPARPSQKKCGYSVTAWLMNVGALRLPFWPRMPVATGVPWEKACSGSWQVAQETVPSAESRVS